MVKFTILLRKRPEMTHEEFVQYHRTKHAPLFMSVPAVQQHVRRYVQGHTIPLVLPGMPPFAYDGTTELWFDTHEDIAKVFGDEEYLRLIRPDEMKFLDLHGCGFLLLAEHVVLSGVLVDK
ncbi:EthD family reductase [Hymenobacter sp. UV11]|uniref:EthD domain-containing protein n=1 Tax=Hymenobacter sp. UV11 TaxID=1849735 RepID=UPI00105DA002|nr:EthD domain-containing protein [Hymenobacter sp. UV11]TDN40284.1 ethyl tert-butyl ether degradation protein EthD [Hymenobacter sp. UV11]TFZ62575.1 EthD family reductase [Hymenobacter sp. UV11]